MPFAPFPPPQYLSDGVRTEGEMKTAFENWLLATKQTGGHGQCRLERLSQTALRLMPHEGRRVLLNDKAYELPATGLAVTNAGLYAHTVWLAVLEDNAGTVTLKLYHVGPGEAMRVIDPDSGVSMVSWDGGTTITRNMTVVGIVVTDGAAEFPPLGVASLHGRMLKSDTVNLGSDLSGGTVAYQTVLAASVAVFAGDTVQCYATMVMQSQVAVAAYVSATGKGEATVRNASVWSLAANSAATLTVHWPVYAQYDGSVAVELGYEVYSGAPIAVKVGTRLGVTRVA